LFCFPFQVGLDAPRAEILRNHPRGAAVVDDVKRLVIGEFLSPLHEATQGHSYSANYQTIASLPLSQRSVVTYVMFVRVILVSLFSLDKSRNIHWFG
jgi:hypothetical protein